ncbi:MAG TPA: lipase [Burkholderiaceae bacterium]
MTPRGYAILARQAYTATPDIGAPSGAGRIVFNSTEIGLVLSIPGTNNLACLGADADALLHDAGEFGQVHCGIWLAFDEVWPDVAKLLPVALTGHSEGAAGAIYLAARLARAGRAPKAVHAFEPPRTSIDAALAHIIQEAGIDLHIYHHGRDVVPLVPLDIPGEDWQHAGPVTRFGKPASIFPNIEDHAIAAVIADL